MAPAPSSSAVVDLSAPQPPPSKLVHTLDAHQGPVHIVKYNVGAKYCLSGGQDRTLRLWNPASGKEIKAYKGHGYEVLGITVSPDNARFASCGGDKAVFLWDVTSGSVIKRFSGHSGKVNAVDFNKDASVLASGSYDASLHLWDMKSQMRSPIQTLTEAKDSITSVVLTDHTLLTGSVDGFVREYDLRAGLLKEDYIGHPITSLTPSPTSPATLLVSTLDSHLRLLDRTNGKVLASFAGHVNTEYRSKASFAYGEGSVVCGDEEGRVWAWGVMNSKPLLPTTTSEPSSKPAPTKPKKIHDKVVTWVETHPSNGEEMLTASADGTVKVWRR
ncbi:nuclear mRNA splicing protein [Mrakia frigida]|uniref:WD40 repeat domain-containing protein n=1 Tax=Mrakia frigida TaxID=29902 RepID=UPI003FCC0D46